MSASVEPFTIGEVETPGPGRIGVCRLPGRSGDLVADLDTAAAWGASTIVSMTELAEMVARGAGALSVETEARGMAWRHFPVSDFGTPEAAAARWRALSAELHRRLDQGESVLLHCAAGLGRSGMVAMRLLVERGVAADDALARVRAARPGAVETEQQRQWASVSG
jgi:protein-tyrosine phosphatase